MRPLHKEEGSASIEALGMMVLLTGMLFIIIFIGVAFYNFSILNTTAQTASLSAQTQMDRYCSPGLQNRDAQCRIGEDKALATVREIADDARPQLMFLVPGSFQLNSNGREVDIQRTGSPVPTAVPGAGALPPGYGYSFVRLQAQFSIWSRKPNTMLPGLSGQMPLQGQSITSSYKDPNS
jgi:hypothetical protein